jgi:hypothetical protein
MFNDSSRFSMWMYRADDGVTFPDDNDDDNDDNGDATAALVTEGFVRRLDNVVRIVFACIMLLYFDFTNLY